MTEAKKHVIVKPFDKVELRLPVEVLLSNPTYKKRRDLFLQGFAVVQSRDASDPKSFYAVAGIHGLPYAPYDLLPGEKMSPSDWNKSETTRWGGYCHHGDILFPTWHRPYVLLLEMLIYEAARNIIYDDKANNYPAGSETDEYKKEVEKIRMPYWDWASPSTLTNGVPSILFDEHVLIDNPTQKDVRIRNPLRAYTLPVDLGSLILVGDRSNPAQRPYSPDSTTPYTPKGYATVRHPDDNYISSPDATGLNVVTFCSSVFRPVLYQVLLVNEWRQFSNHGDGEKEPQDENYGHYSSIEVVHDAVHDSLGGTGGHMSYPDIAGFDPIFFLHHSNVDRLIAIWQACHPDVWIIGNSYTEGTFTQEVDKYIDENTDLTPFRKSETTYWTSKLVRDIKTLGYTYPELEKNHQPRELLRSMLSYYHSTLYLQYHWRLTLTVMKNKVGASFQIRVFLDLPTANASTPISSPNFAGLISIFARGKETQCANCLRNANAVVHGNVDLTSCMKRLFIDTNPEPSGDVVTKSLEPSQITLVAVLKDGSGISLEQAGLISAQYWIFDEGPEFDLEYENWTQKLMGQVYPPQTSQ
ncbi:21643_t:CDS:2 [Dentiscutata erythropus]|uniref:tyrosinase n=1 Tax=Dentiscutata erythropus TaxID=1348616 RepID=A0A9N9FWN2_9GLOM|nr:21643_t:CDS:2 [Dentiscutata erythropus]